MHKRQVRRACQTGVGCVDGRRRLVVVALGVGACPAI